MLKDYVKRLLSDFLLDFRFGSDFLRDIRFGEIRISACGTVSDVNGRALAAWTGKWDLG